MVLYICFQERDSKRNIFRRSAKNLNIRWYFVKLGQKRIGKDMKRDVREI